MDRLTQRQLEPVPGTFESETDEFDLVRYLRALNRNKWRVLLLMILAGILASIYASKLPPVYRGTAVMLVEGQRQKAVTNEELYNLWYATSRDYFLTQFEIIKSRDFAERLTRVMKLTQHPAFDPRQRREPQHVSWLNEFLPSFAPPKPVRQPTDEELFDGVVGAVMGGTSIEPVRNTQLVKLHFDSADPEIAARVPNTLAMIYVVADLEARNEAGRRSTSFLARQSEELKKKLADSERALQAYRERERIIETKGVSSMSGLTRQFEELNATLVQARNRRADAEWTYRQLTSGRPAAALESDPIVLRNTAVQRARDAELEAERNLEEISRRYGPEHPRMATAQRDARVARENLRRQVAGVVLGATKEFELAKASEAASEQALNRVKNEIQERNRKDFQLQALEREVAGNRQLYDQFIQRNKEANVGDMQWTAARVIDEARTPKGPYGPNRRTIVMYWVLGALLLGAGLVVLAERLDNTVKTSDEAEARLDMRLVGVLPETREASDIPLERMVLDPAANSFAESIRTIRSGVLLATLGAQHKIVLVTSSVSEEGKTTLASNLALSMSQLKKTLLVEADMRRPKLGRILCDEGHREGLAELVAEEVPLEQCIHRVSGSELDVLPAGEVPRNPLELLSSPRFADAMEELKKRYDVVIVDSAPVQLVSDALVLAQAATAVLFVVKADSTPYPVARRAVKRLYYADAPVIGSVLNQLNVKKADKYYGEYSGYGDKYYHYRTRAARPDTPTPAEA